MIINYVAARSKAKHQHKPCAIIETWLYYTIMMIWLDRTGSWKWNYVDFILKLFRYGNLLKLKSWNQDGICITLDIDLDITLHIWCKYMKY